MTRDQANIEGIKSVQRFLGHDPDGWAGPATRKAWSAFIASHQGAAPLDTAGQKPADALSPDARFERCLDEVLKFEGGYVDHPRDPGGATNMGITLATLKAWRGVPVSKADVRALTRSEAAAIYHKNYWLASGADAAPAGLDLMLFDASVNHGVGRAVKWVQNILGLKQDGIAGPDTRAALAKADSHSAAMDMAKTRDAFYKSLSTYDTFGKGWMRRLNHVRELAQIWA